jgi:formylglycine-generating enzyme required for sulfatase activity
MPAPSLTICVPSLAGDTIAADVRRIRHLSSLILGADPTVDGWTERNLLGRLSKLTEERACLLVLFATVHDSGSEPVVLLDKTRGVPLATIEQTLFQSGFRPCFLFLVCETANCTRQMGTVADGLGRGQFICWADAADADALVALACEVSNWWDLASLTQTTVEVGYVAERVAILIDRINELQCCSGTIPYRNSLTEKAPAWPDRGSRGVYVHGVDYEKLVSGVRSEQFSDSLKRLADAAYAPRAKHQDRASHLVSSQALFWFCELDQEKVDFNWLASSRLAFELFGGCVAGVPPDSRVEANQEIDRKSAAAFLQDFVAVPRGLYALGSDHDSGMSEPPATPFPMDLTAFKILKRPLAWRDWRIFARSSGQLPRMLDIPVTGCSAFRAFSFAQLLEDSLRDSQLISPTTKVTLPSERQWEAAARGLWDSRDYPWGDEFDSAKCNCDLTYGMGPTPVGQFSPQGDSVFGCQDMAGNVREWTRSYGGVAGVDWQPNGGPEKLRDIDSLSPSDRLVIRGGSYSYDPDCVRTWVRNTQLAARNDSQTGFRLVIEEGGVE